MGGMIEKSGLKVAAELARFIDEDVLPGTGLEAEAFWQGAAGIFARPAQRRASDYAGTLHERAGHTGLRHST